MKTAGPDRFPGENVEQTHLLDRRVTCLQPLSGYRTAIDIVFLAAAVPARAGETVLELGTGCGAGAYCLSHRVVGVEVTGIDLQPAFIALAEQAKPLNRCGPKPHFHVADVTKPDEIQSLGLFDHVMANPPYRRKEAGTPPPDPSKRLAMVEGAGGLEAWLSVARAACRPGGTITFIHDAARLAEICDSLRAHGLAVVCLPLAPSPHKPPKRVLVQGRTGAGPSVTRLDPFVLHGPDQAFTSDAERILRDAMPLQLCG